LATLASQFVQEEGLSERYTGLATSTGAQAVLAEAPVQLRAGDPEPSRCQRLVPFGIEHHALDGLAFDRAKIVGVGWSRSRSSGNIGGQVVNVDPAVLAQDRRALDDVAELPNVARPAVRKKRRLGLRGQRRWRTAVRMRALGQETLGQQHQVL